MEKGRDAATHLCPRPCRRVSLRRLLPPSASAGLPAVMAAEYSVLDPNGSVAICFISRALCGMRGAAMPGASVTRVRMDCCTWVDWSVPKAESLPEIPRFFRLKTRSETGADLKEGHLSPASVGRAGKDLLLSRPILTCPAGTPGGRPHGPPFLRPVR